jgi:metacaspase-1
LASNEAENDGELTHVAALPTAHNNAYNQGNHNAPPPPPQQAQAFGHGAPGGYTFQYSNCSGRRKALLIGINYFGQRGQLRGCINDVKNMSGYLNGHFGYKREDMVLLTDDQQNPMSQPTKVNILRAMHWLVKDAQPNDSLFFHYSGTYVVGWTTPADISQGTEVKPKILMVMKKMAMMKSSILWISGKQATLSTTRCIVSWCNLFDLVFVWRQFLIRVIRVLLWIYHTFTPLKVFSRNRILPKRLVKVSLESFHRMREAILVVWPVLPLVYSRKLFPEMKFTRETFEPRRPQLTLSCGAVRKMNRLRKCSTSPCSILESNRQRVAANQFSSADASISGQATGAMSWAFITALKKNPQQSYVQLLNSIRNELEGKYDQKPQLSCSHPLGMPFPQNSSHYKVLTFQDTNLLYVMWDAHTSSVLGN